MKLSQFKFEEQSKLKDLIARRVKESDEYARIYNRKAKTRNAFFGLNFDAIKVCDEITNK